MQNGTISLKVTPYVGTYDGQEHNALSNISVEPSDAKLEYSINGGQYSTEMPKIKDTSEFTVTVVASKEGYKTQIITETVKVNKAEGNLTLSSTSGTYTYPTSGTFTVSENTGTLSAVSNNTNIATVSVSGSTVTVQPGTTSGKATITVTSAEASNYKAKSATYEATIKNGEITITATPYTGTYDGKAHNAFTSVTTNPSDAKLEYSTDGTTYNPTMPTITNASSFTVTVRASKAGYRTQSTTQTTKVNKANGSLTLSSYSGTSTNSSNLYFTVSGNTGNLSVSSSNNNVATVSISGNTVTIKPVTAGTVTITVKSASNTNYNEKTAIYTATIKNVLFTANSGVGYYADVDGNGTVDGIIFEDFKVGGSGSWYGKSYTIATATELKKYYISQKNYTGKFGTKDVLTPTGSGNARFYIMALNDYGNGGKYEFGIIKSGEWIVPSKNEWIAFASQFGITQSNYSGYGLQRTYWTSSAGDYNGYAYVISFSQGICDTNEIYTYYRRLARTF